MFGRDNFARLRELFANQFEPDGDGFVYRKSLKAAPIRVTASERDAFIAAFNTGLRTLQRVFTAGTVIMIIGMTVVYVAIDQDPGQVPITVAVLLLMAGFMVAWRRLWASPAKALQGRATVGRERSREEMRRRALTALTWPRLGLGAGALGLAYFGLIQSIDVFHGWGRLWLVVGVLIVALICVQAFRKLRSGF